MNISQKDPSSPITTPGETHNDGPHRPGLQPFARGPSSENLAASPWESMNPAQKEQTLARPETSDEDIPPWQLAQPIVDQVRRDGDRALRELGARFDGWRGVWTEGPLALPKSAWDEALDRITPAQRKALEKAIENLEVFHRTQRPKDTVVQSAPGVTCARRFRPLARVGIYVPGGHAPLPSSLLMAAVPARLAGCKQIIVCTPADPEGQVHPAVLAAARLTGVHDLFRSGGAQAVAAMAYGTQEIPKVDKIFGPGNRYVTAAKSLCAMDPKGAAMDMPAGPSEVMVVADHTAHPSWVATDLLSQAEHGVDSHVVLVLKDPSQYRLILQALDEELRDLRRACSRRATDGLSCYERAVQSIHRGSVVYAPTDTQCLDVINRYAPEHLILQVENPRALAEGVDHAGSIFLGPLTPESLGDYASGTNHVLPTYGTARAYSGLGLEAFYKSVTLQEATLEGLRDLAPTVVELATMEGLLAHAAAVTRRLKPLDHPTGLQKSAAPGEAEYAEKISNFDRFVRPLVRAPLTTLRGYESARCLVEKDPAHVDPKIYLDANENHQDPWGQGQGLNRYPDPQPRALRERLARAYRVGPENLLLTSGADQGIDLLVRVFCEGTGDSVVITPPTYGYYAVSAAVQGAHTVKVPLVGPAFDLDAAGIVRAVTKEGSKIVFICSPNNPTGHAFAPETLIGLAAQLRGKALLVVDEAYGEFAPTRTLTSQIGALWPDAPHVVILRTLSKAYGLAGLRLGGLLACPELIKLLQKVRPPYPLSQASIESAEKAFGLIPDLEVGVQTIRIQREMLRRALESSALVKRVYPSETNFLLVAFHEPARVMEGLTRAHLIVRDRTQEERLEDCLRITVGSESENNALMAALTDLAKKGLQTHPGALDPSASLQHHQTPATKGDSHV